MLHNLNYLLEKKLAVAKFEAYQEVLEKIRSDIEQENSRFGSIEAVERFQAQFLLHFMSEQNKHLIAVLTVCNSENETSFLIDKLTLTHSGLIQDINRAVSLVNYIIKTKKEHQNSFLQKLGVYLVFLAVLITTLCFCMFGLAAAVPVLAFALKLNSVVMLVGSGVVMGIAVHRYLNGPGYRYPKLDISVVKNWENDDLYKNGFSTQTFFGQNKSLATLVTEDYQMKIRR